MMSKYAEVILPLPLSGTFTYIVPESMSAHAMIGTRVIVPFGKKKFYTGIIASFSAQAPQGYEVKEITHVLDSSPIVRHPQLRFWEWMSEYYLCGIGEVYNAAVPSGLKIESETRVETNPDFDAADTSLLGERGAIIYQLLTSKGRLTAKELATHTGFPNVTALLSGMVSQGAIIISETLTERFRPKRLKCVRLSIDENNSEALNEAFTAVKGAKKQETMLLALLQLSGYTHAGGSTKMVEQADLLDKSQGSLATLRALEEKGLARRYTEIISRFSASGMKEETLPSLTEAQQNALTSIEAQFADKGVVLLNGVASSGKTEIYAHLINLVLAQKQQVLLLVPEIALTTQLASRLRAYFGDKLLVYHSKFSDNEKVELWRRLLGSSQPCVVLGARSSIFLPFAKLGLVIVDEEHDPSFKQFSPAPRFNARDSAIMLAHMHGAKTLLGSATPAVETYYKAKTGKYGLVELSQRYGEVEFPEIEVVDLSVERKKKALKGAISAPLANAVSSAVKEGKQAILFINRRGYAPMARCTQCQFIPKCKNCDVSLTYHKSSNMLVCHYCGASYPLPHVCPACKEPAIEVVGYGTERIEQDVEEAFPEARTLRMDPDTTRSKNSHSAIIDDFSQRNADILVGTQMVSKGLDFDGVSVVGVVNADTLIHYPDFRSSERAFCLLSQVAGRSGRASKGRVLVQTSSPDHPVVQFVRNNDYAGFYAHEIAERQAYAYPPFSRIIIISLKHRDEAELEQISSVYGQRLREMFGSRVQGPTRPGVARVQGQFIRQFMLKVELNASMPKVKQLLRDLYIRIRSGMPESRALSIVYDVDPS